MPRAHASSSTVPPSPARNELETSSVSSSWSLTEATAAGSDPGTRGPRLERLSETLGASSAAGFGFFFAETHPVCAARSLLARSRCMRADSSRAVVVAASVGGSRRVRTRRAHGGAPGARACERARKRGHQARRTSRSALPGRAAAPRRVRELARERGVTMSAMSLPPALDRRDPPRPPRDAFVNGRCLGSVVFAPENSVTHAMRAAVPLKMRAAAPRAPYRARFPRCAARATTRAPAAAAPRPAAASTVAFDPASPASRGASPSGAASAAAPSHPASHHRGSTATAAGAAAAAAASTATSVPEVACAVSLGYGRRVRGVLPRRAIHRRRVRVSRHPASAGAPCVAYPLLLVGSVAGHAEPDAWQPRGGPERGNLQPFLPSSASTLLSRRAAAGGCTSRASTCSSRGTRRCARRAGVALAHARAGVRVRGPPAGAHSHGGGSGGEEKGGRRRLLRRDVRRDVRVRVRTRARRPRDAPARRTRATKHKSRLSSRLST